MRLSQLLYLVFFTIILFSSSNSSLAEYNSGKIGEAAGAYVYAYCLLGGLKDSPCQYLLKNEINITELIETMTPYLKEEDSIQFKKYINRNLQTLQSEARTFIANFIGTATQNNELDNCTACGMLFQTIALQVGNAKKQWEDQKRFRFRGDID